MTGKRSQTSPVGSPTSGNISDNPSKEQDRFLPIANVSRIMKKSLPANAKISKEAKETVQECVSEFISFITGEASDKCQREKRKTINGDDLLWAMTTLGFENYVGPLKVYLNKYRETEGEKNSMARQEENFQTSPTTKNENTNYTLGVSGSSFTGNEELHRGFNNDGLTYSLGTQGSGKGYGDNLGFSMSGLRGHGDGTANRTMATAQLHHGIDW